MHLFLLLYIPPSITTASVFIALLMDNRLLALFSGYMVLQQQCGRDS